MSGSQGVVWDLSSFFPKFDGPKMRVFEERLRSDVAALQERASALGPLNGDTLSAWEELLLLAEDFEARLDHIFSYVGCLSAADAGNEAYQREEAALTRLAAEASKFQVDLLHAIKAASDEDFAALAAREKLEGARHRLERLREKARHTMSREQEKLATDLNVDGLHAWGRMYDTISGKLDFEMRYPDGRTERVPISQWRALMSHPDREIGRAAFEGGNRAWEGVADVCAFALNAIAGNRLTLNKYRGHESYLDVALYQSQVRRETLEAMYEAICADIEIPRRIFKAKARAMGRPGIWWFEREAPLPLEGERTYGWEEGTAMVARAFRTAYPALADYFSMFLQNRWVESEKRGGKRPGAFCTGSEVTGEQRVYMTFGGALGDVSTLAHEVGHAWHGWLMRDLRPMARSYPMTLAETASLFAEELLAQGLASDPEISETEKLLSLDAGLCDAAIMLLDITVRYVFEREFHDERQKGEVSVSRLKELMAATQKQIWSDALLPDGTDPYFWASKLHFYITGVTFYNFPYTFGFLLAKSISGMFQERGAELLPEYERFLRATGSGSAEEVMKQSLGVDITRPEFWTTGIRSLTESLTLYEELVASHGPL